jgi:hypothetical protein
MKFEKRFGPLGSPSLHNIANDIIKVVEEYNSLNAKR